MNEFTARRIIDLDNISEGFVRLLQERPGEVNPYHCIACGSCSSVCPASGLFYMDPQQFIRLAILDQEREVLNSKWLWVCALCHSCVHACPVSIDIPRIIDTARKLQPHCARPQELRRRVKVSSTTGNNLGRPPSWFSGIVRQEQERLKERPGFEEFTIPVDKKGAECLLILNTRFLNEKPGILGSYARIFHAAKENWTVSSFVLDTSCPAFLAGDECGEKLWSERIETVCRDLGIKTCIMDDCANPFSAFGAGNFRRKANQLPFEVINSTELVFRYLEAGRLNLNPSVFGASVTLHDLCNVKRTQELFDFPRTLLEFFSDNFVELGRHREDSICCGGALLASGLREEALAAGRWKADQIRESGAGTVVVLCKTCYMQIEELIRHYELPCKTAFLPEIIADALKYPSDSCLSKQD